MLLTQRLQPEPVYIGHEPQLVPKDLTWESPFLILIESGLYVCAHSWTEVIVEATRFENAGLRVLILERGR